MRSLSITVALFLLLIICIIFNSLYIHRCADRITEMATEILDGCEARELEMFWNNNKAYVGISISEAQIDNISRIITSIQLDQEYGNTPELEKDVALLLQAVESLRQYESLSIQSLF